MVTGEEALPVMNCARAPSLVWDAFVPLWLKSRQFAECFCRPVLIECLHLKGLGQMWHFRTFSTSGRTSERLNITARVKRLQSAKPLASAERRDCNKCEHHQNCVDVRSRPPARPRPPDCLCLFLRRRIITFALHGETPAIHHPNEVQPGPRSITRCLVSQPR